MTTQSPSSDRYRAANCACFKLRSAARVVTRAYDKALQPAGLKATQFTLLSAINMHESVSISVLADKLAMDRTTLTRNLRPLEARGFVTAASARGRRVELQLTKLGRSVLEQAKPLWQQAQDKFVDALDDSSWQALRNTLTELTRHA